MSGIVEYLIAFPCKTINNELRVTDRCVAECIMFNVSSILQVEQIWPNLGLVSVRYSACRAAVPRGPVSSAITLAAHARRGLIRTLPEYTCA